MTRRPHSSRWLLLGLTWLAFALRVAGITAQSLWRDEVDALIFATRPLSELLGMFRQPGQNGPLFFLALRPWLAAVGQSEFALRFPSALAGALAVPIFYTLVRRLVDDRKPAAIAALLMATAPYLIWYGQEAKMYAALTVLVAGVAAADGRGEPPRRLVAVGFALRHHQPVLLHAPAGRADRARPGVVAGDTTFSAIPPAAALAGRGPLPGCADPALPAAAPLAGANVAFAHVPNRAPVRAARRHPARPDLGIQPGRPARGTAPSRCCPICSPSWPACCSGHSMSGGAPGGSTRCA